MMKSVMMRSKRFMQQLELQTMLWPGVLLLIIFSYWPMYGIVIAFKNYSIISDGMLSGPWVGFKYFKQFLADENFYHVLRNTMGINILSLIIGFPAPIIFAILLNELKGMVFKRFTQTISYLPHFISWVIFSGIMMNLLSVENGAVNDLLMKLGIIREPVFFMGNPDYFWGIAVGTNVLKELGWSSIIYLAAIAAIPQEMYEAATIDGANRFQKAWYITLPSILATVVIILILNVSNLLNWGFDQIWMMQNNVNISMSETLETYVYKLGLQQMRFSYAAAVGLMKSVVAVILLVLVNSTSKRISGKGLY